MGKPIAITNADLQSGEFKLTVTPKSKNAIYEYTGNEEVLFSLDGGFVANGKDITGYMQNYVNFAAKDGDDLVVTTLFTKSNGTAKTVKTTIKNYFADPTADYAMRYKSYNNSTNEMAWTVGDWTIEYIPTWKNQAITPGTDEGVNGLFKAGTEFNDDDVPSYLLGTTGGDRYNATGSADAFIYDTKGDDEYNSSRVDTAVTVYDVTGNDKYNMDNFNGPHSGGRMFINDYKGKDEYRVHGSNSRAMVNDYTGNDFYAFYDSAVFNITDFKGNDYYMLHDNGVGNEQFNNTIIDYSGNDAYALGGYNGVNLETAKAEVHDYAGKDLYIIKDASGVTIDDAAGNDTYNVSDSEGDWDNLTISDDKGNDKYNLTNVKFDDEPESDVITDRSGNDKYTMKDVMNIGIHDYLGNDKYSAIAETNDDAISEVYIYDNTGKDTYVFKGLVTNEISNPADDIYITDNDEKSADKYTLANIDYFDVGDAGGNDKYNIEFSLGQVIDWGTGNDTYTISKMWQGEYMSITDQGGKKDSLIISDSTVDNLVFMADLKQDGTYNSDNMIVYNIERGSYVILNDFFSVTDDAIDGFGDGRIETIKAGNKAIKYNESICDFFNTVKGEMTAWLSDKVGGVMGVLGGDNEGAKEQLIAYFGN